MLFTPIFCSKLELAIYCIQQLRKLQEFVATGNLGGGNEVLEPENIEKCHCALGKVDVGHERIALPGLTARLIQFPATVLAPFYCEALAMQSLRI
jgi:hypothetical protein